MLIKTYLNLYKCLNSYIYWFKIKILKKYPIFVYYHVGDVFFDKITKRSWRIVYIIQDLFGDYDYIMRDDKGRIRALKDYEFDTYVEEYKTIKPIRQVLKDELELDKDLEIKVQNYISHKRQDIQLLNRKK